MFSNNDGRVPKIALSKFHSDRLTSKNRQSCPLNKALKFHAYCPVQNAYFLPAPRRFSSNNGSLLCLITVFTDSNVHLFFFFPQENWTETRSLHLYSLPHNRAVTQRSCLLNTIVFRKNAWMSRSLFTRWLRAQDAGPDMSGNWACLLVQEIPNWVPRTTL